MWAEHDPSPATGAVGALGTRSGPAPLPPPQADPAFSARTTSPSVPDAKLPRLARPRAYKSAPATVNSLRLCGFPEGPLWALRAWPCCPSPSPAEPSP